jgi:hypothetical protein
MLPRFKTLRRIALWMLISLLLAALLAVSLHTSDLIFRLWDRLITAPPAFLAVYAAVILVVTSLFGWITWRVVRRWKRGRPRPRPLDEPLTEAGLRARLQESAALGVDTLDAAAELDELESRRAAQQLYVALFGETSTGKSSLIQALAPHYQTQIDVRSGTTRELAEYAWQTPGGDAVILTDMPGVNAPDQAGDTLSREEAQRAHVVIYLVDGDLTRTQFDDLRRLVALNKVLIVALNKIDRLRGDDLALITQRIKTRLNDDPNVEIVPITAGGVRESIRLHADGREERVTQPQPPRVEALVAALERVLDAQRTQLEPRRDAAVIALAQHKLAQSEGEYRRARAASLISEYTHKAMLGALAAVGPGTDILIQGYLGVAMVREHCKLYHLPVRDLEIDKFLRLVSKDLGKSLPIILTAVGNALKAFPGLGTLAGGVVHAVGYGLVFESLGRALARTLEERGSLMVEPTLRTMEKELSEHLESRARRLARVVLASDADAKHDA